MRNSDKDVLRMPKTIARYAKRLKKVSLQDSNFFLEIKGIEFKHWRLIKNEFPYDKIARKHYLLVSRRRFKNDCDMDTAEREELFRIKENMRITKEFNMVSESLPFSRTVPEHFHLHFLKLKPTAKYKRGLDK